MGGAGPAGGWAAGRAARRSAPPLPPRGGGRAAAGAGNVLIPRLHGPALVRGNGPDRPGAGGGPGGADAPGGPGAALRPDGRGQPGRLPRGPRPPRPDQRTAGGAGGAAGPDPGPGRQRSEGPRGLVAVPRPPGPPGAEAPARRRLPRCQRARVAVPGLAARLRERGPAPLSAAASARLGAGAQRPRLSAAAPDAACPPAAAGAAAGPAAGGPDPLRDFGFADLRQRRRTPCETAGGMRAAQPGRGRRAALRDLGRSAGQRGGSVSRRRRDPHRRGEGRGGPGPALWRRFLPSDAQPPPERRRALGRLGAQARRPDGDHAVSAREGERRPGPLRRRNGSVQRPLSAGAGQ